MSSKQHTYLTGYRGTGKSAVGTILARRLDRPVIDLDQVIEGNAGKSIRQIFADGGEPLFRQLESEALETVSQSKPAVIALGGGAILEPKNRSLIRATGICFWLQATVDSIVTRCQQDPSSVESRPALTMLGQRDEIRQLLSDREPLYREVADHQINTEGKTVAQVADEIETRLTG